MRQIALSFLLVLSLVNPGLCQGTVFLATGAALQVVSGGLPPLPDMSMCATPPTTFRNVWYIDPVAGQTQSAMTTAGISLNPTVTPHQGDATHPWNSAQALFGTKTSGIFGPVPGYSSILYTAVPFGSPGPVAPGDEVLLMNGTAAQYGQLAVGSSDYETNGADTSFLTIGAAPGQTPTFLRMSVSNTFKLAVTGISVQAQQADISTFPIIQANTSGSFTTHDLAFSHITASSITDATAWTQANWISKAAQGPAFQFSSCVSLRNSHFFNLLNSLSVTSDHSTIEDNEFDHFGVDDVDLGNSNIIFRRNHLHDAINLSNGSHIDFVQLFPAGLTEYTDVYIDSNTLIFQEDPALPFTGFSLVINGGIGNTNDDWTNVTIVNNVIDVPNHGVGLQSCHTCTVAGNTITRGTIQLAQHTAQFPVSSNSTNVVVRNNLTTLISSLDPNATIDHNVIVNTSGVAGTNAWYYLGSLLPAFTAPGAYGDNNILDTGGILSEITAYNISTVTYDYHLISTAPARAFGTSTQPVPAVDITGFSRAPAFDVGAYAFH